MTNHSSQNPHLRTEALPTLVANVELHPQAEQRAKEYVDHFSDSLLMQSKALALAQRADAVLSTHVDDARKIIITRQQNSGRLRETLLIAGSAMFGTFLQGFPLEMATNPFRKGIIILNVTMGVVGALLVSWGLARKS